MINFTRHTLIVIGRRNSDTLGCQWVETTLGTLRISNLIPQEGLLCEKTLLPSFLCSKTKMSVELCPKNPGPDTPWTSGIGTDGLSGHIGDVGCVLRRWNCACVHRDAKKLRDWQGAVDSVFVKPITPVGTAKERSAGSLAFQPSLLCSDRCRVIRRMLELYLFENAVGSDRFGWV